MKEKSQPPEVPAAKPGKIGCAPVLIFAIILVLLLGIGSNEAFGYYFKHCGYEEFFDCLLNRVEEEEVEPEGAVVATGTYSFKGYSVNVTANIPLDGGSVIGTIAGTCDGKLKGTFNGKNNGPITGSISGACSPFFVNIPASAQFSGVVNKDSKSVPINFTGKGAGLTHQDTMSLSY
ncbi:hypothetical protein HY345_03865 [Candidatus Microgenomates bacterium]|nr:hypothetical protein [Candidatus Microgenomates bacterium]